MICGDTKTKKIARRQETKKGKAWLGHHKEMSKWPDWEVARSVEESEWRMEPVGEAEVPEIIIVSAAVDSTEVDFDDKSRRKHAEERSSRKEREALGKGSEEIKSPKRKVIRVNHQKRRFT